jgi:hypothetical protein
VEILGPSGIRITQPGFSEAVLYSCTEGGFIYYAYSEGKVGFHKVDNSDKNFPTYDVFWTKQKGSWTETWQYDPKGPDIVY